MLRSIVQDIFLLLFDLITRFVVTVRLVLPEIEIFGRENICATLWPVGASSFVDDAIWWNMRKTFATTDKTSLGMLLTYTVTLSEVLGGCVK